MKQVIAHQNNNLVYYVRTESWHFQNKLSIQLSLEFSCISPGSAVTFAILDNGGFLDPTLRSFQLQIMPVQTDRLQVVTVTMKDYGLSKASVYRHLRAGKRV